MVKCRGTAAIPKNQTAAIRIHDIKLSEGIMLSPSLLRLVLTFQILPLNPQSFKNYTGATKVWLSTSKQNPFKVPRSELCKLSCELLGSTRAKYNTDIFAS